MSEGVIASGHARFPSHLPSAANQASFAATGAFAGACTLPVEYIWDRYALRRGNAVKFFHAAPVYSAVGRFWIFDVVRSALQASTELRLPVAVEGGLAGAAGGFTEICVKALVQRSGLPKPKELASQSSRLFFCFGTYTYLSTTLSEELPPRPFWKCWLLGATAGAFGSTVVAAGEGVRGPQLWRLAPLKGGLVIGTVIATQVTSCKMLLDVVEA